MKKLPNTESLKKLLLLVQNKLELLMVSGQLEEFSREELIMIATGLDEVTKLIEEIENKISALQIRITGIEDSITTIENDVQNKSDLSHTHDDRYYTESEIDSKLSDKSSVTHSHTAAEIGAATDSHNHSGLYLTEEEVGTLLENASSELQAKIDAMKTYCVDLSSTNTDIISFHVSPPFVKYGETQTITYVMKESHSAYAVDRHLYLQDGSIIDNTMNYGSGGGSSSGSGGSSSGSSSSGSSDIPIKIYTTSVDMYGPSKLTFHK